MDFKNISKSIKISILAIMLIFISSIFCYSNAVSEGFISFNNAPRKYIDLPENKLGDINVRIEDNNGIASVQLYTVDEKGKKEKADFSNPNTSDNTKHVYTLSHENFLKGKEKQLYIEVTDGTGNTLKSYFKVCVKSKLIQENNQNKKVEYYAINDAPRILNPVANGSKVLLGVKDATGTKYAKIQDANNKNKEIHKFNNLSGGEQKVTIDMTKFKEVNGVYKLRIITEDRGSQRAVRVICFKQDITAPEKPTTTEEKPTESDGTVSKNKNVTSFVAALERISQRVQSDYKSKIYWKYTNGVRSENRLPLKKTFQSALNSKVLTTNCADYVMWALHDCGIFTADQKFYGNNSGGITYKNSSQTKVKETLKQYATITRIGGSTRPKTLVSEGKLKKGDILTYKGHTNVYAGNGKWYDAGRRMGQNGKGTRSNYTFTTLGPLKITYNQPVYYIIRLKDRS